MVYATMNMLMYLYNIASIKYKFSVAKLITWAFETLIFKTILKSKKVANCTQKRAINPRIWWQLISKIKVGKNICVLWLIQNPNHWWRMCNFCVRYQTTMSSIRRKNRTTTACGFNFQFYRWLIVWQHKSQGVAFLAMRDFFKVSFVFLSICKKFHNI